MSQDRYALPLWAETLLPSPLFFQVFFFFVFQILPIHTALTHVSTFTGIDVDYVQRQKRVSEYYILMTLYCDSKQRIARIFVGGPRSHHFYLGPSIYSGIDSLPHGGGFHSERAISLCQPRNTKIPD